jgi:glutathione S-transferase
MIIVHHLNNSRSQRVLWLLEELGLEYDIKRYQRDAQSMLAPPELRAVHPLGKSPVISDGGVTIAESGAILEYLVDTYGKGRLKPIGAPDLLQYRYFMHYAEGSLMPLLLISLIFARMPLAPMPFFAKPIARAIAKRGRESFVEPQLATHLEFLEETLRKSEWFAGNELTAADIQMSFPLEAAAARAGLDTRFPRLISFIRQTHSRPAYRRALERGGPFELMR